MNFIESLQHKRSQYNYADQARTQAESLKQLSAGIYTEEERFVYELLQNAVDAFIDTDERTLNIRIEIKDNLLCFMHNGATFSESDIEGLCDVGRSNKASNANASNKKKVGYKGIGFKSVFMQSVEYVCVKSGDYCFKFDKNECVELMPKFPDGVLTADEIPWQIIPIACEAPDVFDTSNYNVATYIKTDITKELFVKVYRLLSDPQFLLFLNASNISIELYNAGKLSVKAGRESSGEHVCLLSDGAVISRWLVHTTELIPVDNNVREDLRRDFNTPQKLKEATHFEISFAISINSKGEFVKSENSVVYTFLPTSYRNLGLPFLVNANFITDAGRQQLHQISKWNRLIFENIPKYYLKWIASLSPAHTDYYKVLPSLESHVADSLTTIFDDALKDALDTTAFIPRIEDNVVVKPKDAVIDKLGISTSITQSALIRHINAEYKKSYCINNLVEPHAISLFKEYGVFVFDKKHLPKLLEDTNVFNSISEEYDVKLIEYLYSYDCEHIDEQNEFRQMVKCSKFILDENNKLSAPQDLFLPTAFREGNEIASNVRFVNDIVYSSLNENIIKWLKDNLEVRELSNLSFVDYLFNHNDYITKENAVEIGRYLFKINTDENIFESVSEYKLRTVKFLSCRGRLCTANELYLGDKYKPEVRLEGICDDDIFISSDYLPLNASNTDIAEWKLFFLKFGVKEDIVYDSLYLEADNIGNRCDSLFFDCAISYSERYNNTYQGLTLKDIGWKFQASKVKYKSYPLLYLCGNYEAAKIIISRILSLNDANTILNSFKDNNSISVIGKCGGWNITITKNDLKNADCSSLNHIKWLIDNNAIFPTSQHSCECADNVFSNSIDGIEEIAGAYLPVLDSTTVVSADWLRVFPFKLKLEIRDYLEILSGISNDTTVDNKERITRVYERLVECGYQNDATIAEWGANNKLRSTNGDFYKPEELSYITIDGFNNKNKVYIGKVANSLHDGVLCLLRNFGVKVITKDNITPKTTGEIKNDTLKTRLREKLQYLAILKWDGTDKTSYDKAFNDIDRMINDGMFYQCDKIELSYGNDDDVIPKLTFSQDNRFYYTGKLKPSKLELLTQPLVRFFGLRGFEKELLIILITDSHVEIVEFLIDKGYDVQYLKTSNDLIEQHTHTSIDSNQLAEQTSRIDSLQKEKDDGHLNQKNEDDAVVEGTSDSDMSIEEMYAAQIEAQNCLMKEFPDWQFPQNYGERTENGAPYYGSTIELRNEIDEIIPIVLKSYNDHTKPFKINPNEWDYLMKEHAVLLIYTDSDIKRYYIRDLIRMQSSITISFSTENLDVEDKINVFADALHYFNAIHFDFKSFNTSDKVQSAAELYKRNKRAFFANDNSEDDI